MPNLNQKQWEKELVRDMANEVKKEVPRIAGDVQRFAKQSYTKFPRNPIDTGLSQEETNANVELKNNGSALPYLSVAVEIEGEPEKYAEYFIKGIGSNRPYGRRDVLQSALQAFVSKYNVDIRVKPTEIN